MSVVQKDSLGYNVVFRGVDVTGAVTRVDFQSNGAGFFVMNDEDGQERSYKTDFTVEYKGHLVYRAPTS